MLMVICLDHEPLGYSVTMPDGSVEVVLVFDCVRVYRHGHLISGLRSAMGQMEEFVNVTFIPSSQRTLTLCLLILLIS